MRLIRLCHINSILFFLHIIFVPFCSTLPHLPHQKNFDLNLALLWFAQISFLLSHCSCPPDKPKFNNYINFIQLDEHESRQLDVMVRANPSVDNLVFNRVKETTSQSASRTNVTQYQQRVTILDDLIDDYANISWMVEPMPTHWSFILTGDQIRLNIVNVTAIDSGLYMARVSNTLGDSVFFTRIHVKSKHTSYLFICIVRL